MQQVGETLGLAAESGCWHLAEPLPGGVLLVPTIGNSPDSCEVSQAVSTSCQETDNHTQTDRRPSSVAERRGLPLRNALDLSNRAVVTHWPAGAAHDPPTFALR